MPFSEIIFDNEIKTLIKESDYKSYLDIGAGAGKYGIMIKDIFPNSIVEAIEIEKDYVQIYGLEKIYDKVYVEDVISFIDEYVDNSYEVCVIGDCIEHLKKSDGISLIEFLIYRTKVIIIVFPTRYIQYSWNGYKNEAHRSVWCENDFRNYDAKYMSKMNMNVVVIKGYL